MFEKIKENSVVFAIILIASLVGCNGGDDDKASPVEQTSNEAGDGQLNAELEKIRSSYDVPAVAGFIVNNKTLIESAAVGKRSQDADEPVAINDRWHIGSITKSMTATLAGVLVDEGLISWNSTIADVFPEFQDTILTKYHKIELQQLLSMTSGLEDDFNNPAYQTLDFDQTETEQRVQGTRLALSYDHGLIAGQFRYANLSYVIAGAMLEKVSQIDWASLLQQRVFTPLAVNEFGFGAPGVDGLLDQPLGHKREGSVYKGMYEDNPPILSPAGRVNISLADMASYAMFHLQGIRGEGTLLSEGVFTELYRSRSSENYALGWLVSNATLTHNGSNTLWYADMFIDAERNFATFAVVNAGDENAEQAVEKTIDMLSTRFNNSIDTP